MNYFPKLEASKQCDLLWFAAETRGLGRGLPLYASPEMSRETIRKLETTGDGTFGLRFQQGGKSSTLLILETGRMHHRLEEYSEERISGELVSWASLGPSLSGSGGTTLPRRKRLIRDVGP